MRHTWGSLLAVALACACTVTSLSGCGGSSTAGGGSSAAGGGSSAAGGSSSTAGGSSSPAGGSSSTAGGGSSTAGGAAPQSEGAALTSYLRQVEPIRLAVNRLLKGADPILSAYHEGRISPRQAAQRMGLLERRFAAYTVDMAALQPRTARLRMLNAPYAHTYILEDSYLSALTNGLAERDLDGLPDTQAAQRAAIIQWRTGLTVLARAAGLDLPADMQAAGRGEIAPSPDGS